MRILAIDPGNDTGWSFWNDGVLDQCGLGAPPGAGVRAPDAIITEIPNFQRDGVSLRDVVVLSLTAGRQVQRATGMFFRSASECFAVFPATWKGTIGKAMHNERTEKTIATLGMMGPVNIAFTRVPAAKQHNVWDAVGLGLWASEKVRIGEKLGQAPIKTLRSVSDYAFKDL